MSDISADVEDRFAALDCLTLPQLHWLKARGVPADAIAYPEMPAQAEVVFHPGSPFFDFKADLDEETEATCAMILMARDQFGEPADLVAWSPRMHRLATWGGFDLPLLGWENALTVRPDLGDALAVHPSPLEWLRDGREGVVILKPDRARWYLEGFTLKVEDAAFARGLSDALRWPEPRVRVETRTRAAA